MRARTIPDRRRKPILKSERLVPVAPEISTLAELEESQVDPGYEETELDKHIGRWAEEEDKDVGNEEVDPW